MQLPSWNELTNKVSKFEQKVNKEISKQVKDLSAKHPLMTTAFKTSLHILPPPFDAIVREIYDSFEGSDEEKFEAVKKYLYQIQQQGEDHYNKITSRLNDISYDLNELKNINVQQRSLLYSMKEIMVSTGYDVNKKIGDLKDQLIQVNAKLEENSVLQHETYLNTFRILQKLDLHFPEVMSIVVKKPFRTNVIAEKQGDTIVFKSRYNQASVGTITHNDFKNLNPRQLQLIQAYEQSMEKQFDKWIAKKGEGDKYTDLEKSQEMRKIAEGMCSDWSDIVRSLGNIGYQLEDHYGHIVNICEGEGLLELF